MILVTGANGQLGGDVCKILEKAGIDFLPADKDTFDITDREKTFEFFEKNHIESVIHCAAYTAVDKAEDEEEKCTAVNFEGTKNIALCCKKYDCKLIYVSTDYVFDGSGSAPFEISGKKAPLNVYGKSKLLGEQAVSENCKKHFIVRTSWVFGEKNQNFIFKMLELSQSHKQVSVVCDQIGSPTYSNHLAALLCKIIQSEKYGVYHATNEGFCSWAELAKKTFEKAGKQTEVIPVTTAQYKSRAKRPLNSRLSKLSLDGAGFSRLPSWEAALEEYLSNIGIVPQSGNK